MRNIYEIFDDFEQANSKKERMTVIEKNLSKTLVQVLELTFHPDYQWHITNIPENYIYPEQNKIPGLSPVQLSTELRKMYMFRKGEPTADNLTPQKREQLLLQILESIEPREAEVVGGILRKDQGVRGLDYKFVKEAFPNLIP
jgi:hypothetical protein